MPFNIDDDLISNIQNERNTITVNTESNQATVNDTQGTDLVTKISEAYNNIDAKFAFIGLCIICQKGGTSRRAQGDIYAVVNSNRITLARIRSVMSAQNYRFTLRQWARTYATKIHAVASMYSIPGDLAKKIGRKHSGITPEQSIWLSNFQMDNPDCPEDLRNLILEHFQDLFPGSSDSR